VFVAKSLNKPEVSIKKFILGKMVRIYPLYVCAVVLFALMGISGGRNSVYGLLLLSMFLGPALTTLWYVSCLMTYVALAVLLHIFIKYWSVVKVAAIIAIGTIVLTMYDMASGLLDHRVILYLPCFVIGIATQKCSLRQLYANEIVATAALGAIWLATMFFAVSAEFMLRTAIVTVVSFFLVFYSPKIHVRSDLLNGAITKVGYSTYCMYLFHRPIYKCLVKIFRPQGLFSQVLYLITIGICMVVFVSYYLQKGYDLIITRVRD